MFHSNGLIVDFPRSGRSNASHAVDNSTSSRRVRKSVRFSPTSELHSYTTTQEKEVNFYSMQDVHRFRRNTALDRNKIRIVLSSRHADTLAPEELCECIGLESILSNEIIIRVRENRRRHVQQIIMMQEYQRQGRIANDDDVIRVTSEESSQFSRDRAHHLAVRYYRLSSMDE